MLLLCAFSSSFQTGMSQDVAKSDESFFTALKRYVQFVRHDDEGSVEDSVRKTLGLETANESDADSAVAALVGGTGEEAQGPADAALTFVKPSMAAEDGIQKSASLRHLAGDRPNHLEDLASLAGEPFSISSEAAVPPSALAATHVNTASPSAIPAVSAGAALVPAPSPSRAGVVPSAEQPVSVITAELPVPRRTLFNDTKEPYHELAASAFSSEAQAGPLTRLSPHQAAHHPSTQRQQPAALQRTAGSKPVAGAANAQIPKALPTIPPKPSAGQADSLLADSAVAAPARTLQRLSGAKAQVGGSASPGAAAAKPKAKAEAVAQPKVQVRVHQVARTGEEIQAERARILAVRRLQRTLGRLREARRRRLDLMRGARAAEHKRDAVQKRRRAAEEKLRSIAAPAVLDLVKSADLSEARSHESRMQEKRVARKQIKQATLALRKFRNTGKQYAAQAHKVSVTEKLLQNAKESAMKQVKEARQVEAEVEQHAAQQRKLQRLSAKEQAAKEMRDNALQAYRGASAKAKLEVQRYKSAESTEALTKTVTDDVRRALDHIIHSSQAETEASKPEVQKDNDPLRENEVGASRGRSSQNSGKEGLLSHLRLPGGSVPPFTWTS